MAKAQLNFLGIVAPDYHKVLLPIIQIPSLPPLYLSLPKLEAHSKNPTPEQYHQLKLSFPF
jgi:hypothetical protein